jgi:hypothetical protein
MSTSESAEQVAAATAGQRDLFIEALRAALRKLTVWLLVGVTLELLPVMIKAGRASILTTSNRSETLDQLLADGETLIIAAIFVGAAAVELAIRKPVVFHSSFLRGLLIGICFIVACMATGWFANIDALQSVNNPMEAADVAAQAKATFVVSLFIAGCCVVTSEL